MITAESIKKSYQLTMPKFTKGEISGELNTKAYTEEFKQTIIDAVNCGMTSTTAAERFVVPLSAVTEIMKTYKKGIS
jgi:hypothetical protein